MSSSVSFKIKKLADLATIFGAQWRPIWERVKVVTETTQRKPRTVTVWPKPHSLYLNDGECAKRFAVNLVTGEISEAVSVSSGEWACHGGPRTDLPIEGAPANVIIVTVTWHEYYRALYLDVQAPADMFERALKSA